MDHRVVKQFDARISMIANNYISVLLTDVSVPYFTFSAMSIRY